MATNHRAFQYGAGAIWQVSGERSLYSVKGVRKKNGDIDVHTDTHKRN